MTRPSVTMPPSRWGGLPSTPATLVLGTAGAVLMVAGGLIVGPRPPFGSMPQWLGYIATNVGLVLLVGAWLLVGMAIRQYRGPTARQLLTLAAAWSTPFILGPALYSQDVYSYAAQGRLANLGLNPYHHGPASLGPSPYLAAVSHVWLRTHAPYGPLFVGVESFVTRVLPGVTAAVYGLRVVELAGVVLLALFLPRLARHLGADERVALWLGLLNPLVLAHLVSGAHNDALMLGLLVAGLALAGEGQFARGLVLCTLAAAVKAPAGLGALYVAGDWLVSERARGDLRRVATQVLAITVGTFVVVTRLVGFGWGWMTAVGTPGRVHSMLSPTTAVGTIIARVVSFVHPGSTGAVAITLARSVGVGAALLVLPVLFAGRRRLGSVRTLALSLLAVVLLGPVVQPWYLLWAVVLVAAAGPGRLLAPAVWISACLPFLVMPDGTSAADVILLTFLLLSGAVVSVALSDRLPTVDAA